MGFDLFCSHGKHNHGTEVTYLMSRATLFKVCFFTHDFLETQEIPEHPCGKVFWSTARTLGFNPKSNPTSDGVQTKGFKASGSRPWLFPSHQASFSQTPGFPNQLFMTSKLIPTFALDSVQLANLYCKPH